MIEYCGHNKNKINFDSKDYCHICCRNVTHCHPIQDYNHQDDNILPIYEMTLGFKPFTKTQPAWQALGNKWAQERTGACEGDTRVSLARARSFLRPFISQHLLHRLTKINISSFKNKYLQGSKGLHRQTITFCRGYPH